MRVAITGGTGFLGRYIIERLAADGHSLRGWYREQKRTAPIAAPVEWRQGMLGDAAAADWLVNGADAVVHAALQWPGRRSDRSRVDLMEFAQANLMGSLLLMQAARNAGVGRFVFISTCAVHDTILSDRPLDEAHPLWPHGHYGAHKAALEKFVHSLGLGDGWPICSLRPTGIYGLTTPPEKSKWFELVGRVVRGEAIESAASGKEVHAADVARAVALLLKADPERIRGQAFNCYDQYVAEQRVAQMAKELCGSASRIADLNRGPKNQIDTTKIRSLGMKFGGEALLRKTVGQLVELHRK